MNDALKSPEDLANEAAKLAAENASAAAAKKEKADAEKAAAKATKDQEKADKAAFKAAEKATKASAKEEAKQAAVDAKAAKGKLKEDEKAAREVAKTVNQMPEQNGIRRPKPETLCGKAWGVMDSESAKIGQPVSIAAVLAVTSPMGLVDGNVKSEYARWRKFNGVTGRIGAPVVPAAQAEGVPGTATEAPAAV